MRPARRRCSPTRTARRRRAAGRSGSRRCLVEHRPGARGVGHDERDAVLAQQRRERRVAEALVPRLDGVPQRAVGVGRGERAPVEALVVLLARAGPRRRWCAAAAPGRPPSARRRTASAAAAATAPARAWGRARARPEARKFATGVATSRSCFMCVTNRGPLTAKTKSSGVSARPRAPALRPLQRVEGAVDLDGVDAAGEVLQLAALRRGPPGRTCGATADSATPMSRPVPASRPTACRMSGMDAVIVTGAAGALGHAVVDEFLARRARGGRARPAVPRARRPRRAGERPRHRRRPGLPRGRPGGVHAGRRAAGHGERARRARGRVHARQAGRHHRGASSTASSRPTSAPRCGRRRPWRRGSRAGGAIVMVGLEDRGHRARAGRARHQQGGGRAARPDPRRRSCGPSTSASTPCCRR